MKSTADVGEIDHFQKLSPSWWDEMGGSKPLHSMNQLRIPFIRDGLISNGVVKKNLEGTPTPLKELVILDVGCGGNDS